MQSLRSAHALATHTIKIMQRQADRLENNPAKNAGLQRCIERSKQQQKAPGAGPGRTRPQPGQQQGVRYRRMSNLAPLRIPTLE